MSHYAEQYTSQENINRHLKKLWSNERLNAEQIALLNEYQTLRWNPDEMFLRACAQEAVNKLNSEKFVNRLVLTEWWVSFSDTLEWRYYNEYWTERSKADEKAYADDLANANQEFLDRWNELRKKKKKQLEELDQHLWAIRGLINGNPNLFRTPKLVAQMLENEWFEIQNPEVMEMTTTEMLEKWIKIHWTKADWTEKEVTFMPNRELLLHVDHPNWWKACADLSKKFEKQIADLVWWLTGFCWAPRYIQTRRSWIWRWEVKVWLETKQEDQEENKQDKPKTLEN